MEKLIGYTPLDDLEDFCEDGVIRVRLKRSGIYTEEVLFTENDVEVSPLTSLSEEMEEFFYMNLPILLKSFTKEYK